MNWWNNFIQGVMGRENQVGVRRPVGGLNLYSPTAPVRQQSLQDASVNAKLADMELRKAAEVAKREEEAALLKVANEMQVERDLHNVGAELQVERDGLLNRRMHEDIPIVDTGFKPRREVTNKTATVGSDRIGEGDSRTFTKNGKSLANVTAEQLSATGMSLRGYMNAWKQFGQRPTPERMREWFK